MRVLITGGNGYVGRALTRRLYRAHDVWVLDNLRCSGLRFGSEELHRFQMAPVDIRDREAVQNAFAAIAPEVVIHLAAIHFIPECEERPDDAIATNVIGTANVLRACRPNTRFLFTSSAAVYAPERTPHTEVGSPLGPMDVYGLTKLHGEHFVRYFAGQMRLDATIVRLFNVIGPGETNPHIAPAILAQLLKGRRTLSLGNVHPKRDYIHVEDAARGFAALALKRHGDAQLDIVNLGTGKAYSVEEMVAAFAETMGEDLTIEADPDRMRSVDRPFAAADAETIRREYSWSPRFSFADSIRDLWNAPDVSPALLEGS